MAKKSGTTSQSTGSKPDLEQVRAKATEILNLIQEDPKLRDEARRDPFGFLNRYGLPERGMIDFVRETSSHPEGLNLWIPTCTCNDLTCIITRCPESCYVTLCGSTLFFAEKRD